MESRAGTAAELHGRPFPDPARRVVWIHRVTRRALVLGSGQRRLEVDAGAAAAAGVDVVRRRSGGGAVLLEPGQAVWIDLVIPAGDPLWSDDVTRAFGWVGRAWADALAALGVAAELNERPQPQTRWSRLVCFAGVGAGELTVDERKVLGLSQRRTRAAARFQGLLLLSWDATLLCELLGIPEANDELACVATGVPVDHDAAVQAFLHSIPGSGVVR